MIKIENVSVAGFEAAIRGLRNPKNSWAKSDSHRGLCGDGWTYDPGFIIGPADKELMMKLNRGGPVHAKYRRQIVVWCDITAPLRWWKEFDTYRFGRERNSCSTMHKIADHEFTIEDFSYEKLDMTEPCISIGWDERDTAVIRLGAGTKAPHTIEIASRGILELTIRALNYWREEYLRAKESKDKVREYQCFQQMIDLLPDSYMQRATIMMSYEVLANILSTRRFHKQEEWRTFCKWAEDELPYSWIFTGEEAPIVKLAKGENCATTTEDTGPHYFVCNIEKHMIPNVRITNGSLWFEEQKAGKLVAVNEDNTWFVRLVYELTDEFDYLWEHDIKEFNFGFTINPSEDEIQLRLYRKE